MLAEPFFSLAYQVSAMGFRVLAFGYWVSAAA